MVSFKRKETGLTHKIISAFVAFSFIFTSVLPPQVAAQSLPTILNLPAPGMMVTPTIGFTPAILRGITINPENPLNFTFYVSKGDTKITDAELQQQSSTLIKYFLATLTTPSQDLWVNLSPYQKDQMITTEFGLTEMGRDLLAQDYVLKQLTASLMYPENELGQKFWKRVHQKAYDRFGTTEIPVETFNKIWIVPERAAVYEHNGSAFVVKSHLKVMLAQDYLALQESIGRKAHGLAQVGQQDENAKSELVSNLIQEILIPEIEKEVNEGETFANLRQVFNSMILATWFKNNLKETLLGQVYVNQKKVAGVNVDDPEVKEKIYQQYLKAFNLGVYNYIKEEYDPSKQKIVPRQYFSGGAGFQGIDSAVLAETYTDLSLKFAPVEVVRGAQAIAEDAAMVALDVDLYEADASGKNEAVIAAAVEQSDQAMSAKAPTRVQQKIAQIAQRANGRAVADFVERYAGIYNAAELEIIGADDEERLIKEAIAAGELYDMSHGPYGKGTYVGASHPSDVQRVVARTFVATNNPADKGKYNNWVKADDIKAKVMPYFRNALGGTNKLYLIPFIMEQEGTGYGVASFQLTDSRYVALQSLTMAGVGEEAWRTLAKTGKFNRGIHLTGDLDKLTEEREQTGTDNRHFISLPEEGLTISYGSNYGGNVLFGKKFEGLRLASWQAAKAWDQGEFKLAEHMALIQVKNLKTGIVRNIAFAAPSNSGKTNFAMMKVPDIYKDKYEIKPISDDLSHMRIIDGKLMAFNPERGVFGVVTDTDPEKNPKFWDAITTPGKKVIFTNMAYNLVTGEIAWKGNDTFPGDITNWRDWQGNLISDRQISQTDLDHTKVAELKGKKLADLTPRQRDLLKWTKAALEHPNGRATIPVANVTSLSQDYYNTQGVEVHAIFHGGRVGTKGFEPLVRRLRTPQEGIYSLMTMLVESTAAEVGKVGEKMRDPAAMRPFFSLHEIEYFEHWERMMEKLGNNAPAFFHVNWFAKDDSGRIMWPGYSENLRVIDWALRLLDGEAEYESTPIGDVPTVGDRGLDISGLTISDQTMSDVLSVNPEIWKDEARDALVFLESLANEQRPLPQMFRTINQQILQGFQDAAMIALTKEESFAWTSTNGSQTVGNNTLTIDPHKNNLLLNLSGRRPVKVLFDRNEGVIGTNTRYGKRLPKIATDIPGHERRYEYVDAQQFGQFEIVHEVILTPKAFQMLKDNEVDAKLDITSRTIDAGTVKYTSPTRVIIFKAKDQAQLGEVDMAKFKITQQWQGELAPYTGEGKVINAETNKLKAQLTQKWAGTIAALLRKRGQKQEAVDAGKAKHGFMAAGQVVEDAYGERKTAQEIRDGDWVVDAVPEPLTRPGAILTGPWGDPKWAINSLSSGAVRIFNDYEDAGWDKGIAGIKAQQTQMDILNGKITSYQGPKREYSVPDRSEWPVLTTRVRGLHFNSKFFNYDSVKTPAIIEDLVSLIVNNREQLIAQGSGINVVIPKLQSAEELKTVAQIISDIEQATGLKRGTVKIILMNERIELSLELEEALWAARHHVAVTNVGRWDKLASDIMARRNTSNEIEPNPTAVGVDSPHMQAYINRNVAISLKRGAEPEGGMVVQMMSRGGSHPETDDWVVQKIKSDKVTERNQGMKFAWVATPQVVDAVNEIFQAGDYTNRQAEKYGYSTEEEAKLLELPKGPRTKEGVRKAVYDALAYAIGFRTAGGAVAIVDESRPGLRLMQDLAVLKINYYWLWKLVKHQASLDDSEQKVTTQYIGQVIDEQVAYIKSMADPTDGRADRFEDKDWDAVGQTLKQLVTASQMVTWESVVMNALIDEQDTDVLAARLKGVFSSRKELEADLLRLRKQKQNLRLAKIALAAHDEVFYNPNIVNLTDDEKANLRINASRMVPKNGGILAADESTGSAKKRLDMVGLENTGENRQEMRRLMLTADGLAESGINSVILYKETFDNVDLEGRNIVRSHLLGKGILPGIKTDGGLVPDAQSEGEELPNPEGLVNLPSMLAVYKAKGAVFTKWRTVQHINPETGLPTDRNIRLNATVQAQQAKLTQEAGLVPIVEPEVMFEKSAHSLEASYDATTRTLAITFEELIKAGVYLEGMVLKTSMILAGQKAAGQTDSRTVGFETLKGLLKTVPAKVPAIVFLSGGQDDTQVVENMNEVILASQQRFAEARDAAVAELEREGNGERADEVRALTQAPWEISYSFGRGLQRPALLAWNGKTEGFENGQRTMTDTARNVQKARLGQLHVDNAVLSDKPIEEMDLGELTTYKGQVVAALEAEEATGLVWGQNMLATEEDRLRGEGRRSTTEWRTLLSAIETRISTYDQAMFAEGDQYLTELAGQLHQIDQRLAFLRGEGVEFHPEVGSAASLRENRQQVKTLFGIATGAVTDEVAEDILRRIYENQGLEDAAMISSGEEDGIGVHDQGILKEVPASSVAQREAEVMQQWGFQRGEQGRWIKRRHTVHQVAAYQYSRSGRTWVTTNAVQNNFNTKLRRHFRRGTGMGTYGSSNNVQAEAMVRSKIKVNAPVYEVDLIDVTDDTAGLRNDLIVHGYLDSDGRISQKLFDIKRKADFQLSETYKSVEERTLGVLLYLAYKKIEGDYKGGWDAIMQEGSTDQARSFRGPMYLGELSAKIARLFKRHDSSQNVKMDKMTPDARETFELHNRVDFDWPLFVDADEGHLKIRELVQAVMTMGPEDSLIAALHIEDQAHGCKKCGHMSGKVLSGTEQWLRVLNNARFQFDAMGLNTMIVARTDGEAAEWITTTLDGRDQRFLFGATDFNAAFEAHKAKVLADARKKQKTEPEIDEITRNLEKSRTLLSDATTGLIRPYHEVIEEARGKGIDGAKIQTLHATWKSIAGLMSIQKAVEVALQKADDAGQSLGITRADWETYKSAYLLNAQNAPKGRKAAQFIARVESAIVGDRIQMTVPAWQDFIDNIPAEKNIKFFAAVKGLAASMGLEVVNTEEWRTLQRTSPERLNDANLIFWDFELTKTEENDRQLWMINSGIEMASARSVAAMPQADISWMEQHHPHVGEVKHWAEAIDTAAVNLVVDEFLYEIMGNEKIESLKEPVAVILEKYLHERPDNPQSFIVARQALLALGLSRKQTFDTLNAVTRLKANNTSPSFFWPEAKNEEGTALMSDEEKSQFLIEQGKYSQFNFATYFGSVLLHVQNQLFNSGFPSDLPEKQRAEAETTWNALKASLDRGGYLADGMLTVSLTQKLGRLISNEFVANPQIFSGTDANAWADAAGNGMATVLAALGGQGDTMELSKSTQRADQAMQAQRPDVKGGIDLNPELLDLQIKRDGNGIPLPMLQQPVDVLKNIEGFIPVIINVTPVTNMPLILGLNGREGDPTQYSYDDHEYQSDEPKAKLDDAEFDQISLLK